MSSLQDSYRSTGLIIVGLAIFLIAVDLAVFTLCNGAQSVCFSWETNRVSDLSLLVFFGLFMVGIGLLAWPVDEETDFLPAPRAAPGTPEASPGPLPPPPPPPDAYRSPPPPPRPLPRSRRSYPEAAPVGSARKPGRPEGEGFRP